MLEAVGRGEVGGTGLQLQVLDLAVFRPCHIPSPSILVPNVLVFLRLVWIFPRCWLAVDAHSKCPDTSEGQGQVQQGCRTVLVRGQVQGPCAPPDLGLYHAELAPAHEALHDIVQQPAPFPLLPVVVVLLDLALHLQVHEGLHHLGPDLIVCTTEGFREGDVAGWCSHDLAWLSDAGHEELRRLPERWSSVPVRLQDRLLLVQSESPLRPTVGHVARLRPVVHSAEERPLRILMKKIRHLGRWRFQESGQ
mmetsp:Transcript_69324/g.153323  ORF Transcript_69324/g.153323 Transcript_69324/m.153323 type:complete len:250 (+) Transcript_69324:44-793(+)